MKNIKRTERIKTTTTISLNKDEILQLLYDSGQISKEDMETASVEFTVPGGGDWSYMDIDIDKSNPISVTYEQVVEKVAGE